MVVLMEYKCTELKIKCLKRKDWIIGPEKYGTQFVHRRVDI